MDFNQGIDARLLTEEIIVQLSRIEIKPLRIAFDHADEKNVHIYKEAQWRAAKHGFKYLSNYVLFNFEDTPEELYFRLKINIDLNERFKKEGLNTCIWSFPMKYSPFLGEHCRDRKYIGTHWNAKMLRGIQCILSATHGVVGPKRKFFEHAFGNSYEEFEKIIYLPEHYIIKRRESENLITEWKDEYQELKDEERKEFIQLIKDNKFIDKKIENPKIRKLYQRYIV